MVQRACKIVETQDAMAGTENVMSYPKIFKSNYIEMSILITLIYA